MMVKTEVEVVEFIKHSPKETNYVVQKTMNNKKINQSHSPAKALSAVDLTLWNGAGFIELAK